VVELSKKYEITNRGKVVITIIVVILLLLLPASLFAISSCNRKPPSDDTLSKPPLPTEDITITEPPLPTDGSGFDPSDTTDSEPTSSTQEDTSDNSGNGVQGNGNGTTDPPEYGPVGLNISEGTMLFIFSPKAQDALDNATVEMLSEFLSSPKNTGNAQIQVEMPRISDDDTTVLLAAVKEAFALYDVPIADIVYVKNQTAVTEDYFEVALSYYIPHELK
jgi:hypothetical protein